MLDHPGVRLQQAQIGAAAGPVARVRHAPHLDAVGLGDGSIASFVAPGELVHGQPEMLHVQDQGSVPPDPSRAVPDAQPHPEHWVRPGRERTNDRVVSRQSQDAVGGGRVADLNFARTSDASQNALVR